MANTLSLTTTLFQRFGCHPLADKRKPKRKQGKPTARPKGSIGVRRVAGQDAWQLVHPRCAEERKEDIEEVHAMIEGGEADIAIDEIRWLLSGCSDFIDAHGLLGMLALGEDDDLELARGHFGYAYQLGLTAHRRAGLPAPLPYRIEANQAFFEAGKGLAHCLSKLGRPKMAREVLDHLLDCDPSDPLGLAEMRDRLPAEGD